MRLNERLNLVLPVDRDGTTVYVHSTPISREVFERFYLPIAKTLAKVGTNDLGMVSGPRVAALILKDAAKECGMWEGEQGVERGLLPEIRRLTNVVAFGPDGWRPFPFDKAISEKFFDRGRSSGGRERHRFFYCSLTHGEEEREADSTRRVCESVGCGNYLVELYGVRRFIADIDRDREYWREGDTICHSVLTWLAGDGLPEYLRQFKQDFSSAHEWRQRYLLAALRRM